MTSSSSFDDGGRASSNIGCRESCPFTGLMGMSSNRRKTGISPAQPLFTLPSIVYALEGYKYHRNPLRTRSERLSHFILKTGYASHAMVRCRASTAVPLQTVWEVRDTVPFSNFVREFQLG